jgi:hypothetical protein
VSDEVKILLQRSHRIRSGQQVPADEGYALAKQLANAQQFDAARRLALYLINIGNVDPDDPVKIRQQLALWISKNPDASDDSEHDEAIVVLDSIGRTEGGGHLAETNVPETLGIAGGILKRKWLVTGRREDLEQSLRYYQ